VKHLNWYCDEYGNLIQDCSKCGCVNGTCQENGICVVVNSPPALNGIPDKDVKEGKKLDFYVTATDADQDNLYFHASNLPIGSAFSQNGYFSWTPTYEQTGNYFPTFCVYDGRGGSDCRIIRITVGDVNRPPSLAIGTGEQGVTLPEGTMERKYIEIQENVMLMIKITGEDPDGDQIYYTVENLPGGAEFDDETGRFQWVPGFGQQGNYEVRFTVSDGERQSTIEVVISIGDVNRPPKAKISHPVEGQELLTNRYVLMSASESYDPDEEALEYAWDFGDGATEITNRSTTKHMYKTPGEYGIKLSVTDGGGLYSTREAGRGCQRTAIATVWTIHLTDVRERNLSRRSTYTGARCQNSRSSAARRPRISPMWIS
jgi:hypothetical protein